MLTEDGDGRDEQEQERERERKRKQTQRWWSYHLYRERQEIKRQGELFQARRAYEWARAFPYGLGRAAQLPASERLISRQAAAELRVWYDRTL